MHKGLTTKNATLPIRKVRQVLETLSDGLRKQNVGRVDALGGFLYRKNSPFSGAGLAAIA